MAETQRKARIGLKRAISKPPVCCCLILKCVLVENGTALWAVLFFAEIYQDHIALSEDSTFFW